LNAKDEEIDLSTIHQDLVALDQQIKEATNKHNAFLKELGLPILP
jgi:type I restriction enzyme M protein